MPFTGSIFSRLYNWENDRDAAINILAARMDAEFDGYTNAINDIMAGSIPFTGAVKGSSGAVSAPAWSFSADTNTGLYRIGADNLGVATGGGKRLDISNTRISSVVAFKVEVTGNVAAGNSDHGLFIKGPSPTLTFVDTETGHGSAQWQFSNNVLKLLIDTDNDENIGATANTSDTELFNITNGVFQFLTNTVWHSGNDGPTSGLNADFLDGQHGSYFQNASNLNAGTVPSGRLSGTYSISILGNAATATTATNSTQLNGQAASFYQNASNLNAGTLPSGRLSGTYSISISGNAATATTATNSTQLNGQTASFYTNASNLSSGTIPVARLPKKQSWIPTGVTSYTASDCVYVEHGDAVTVSFRGVLTSDNTIGGLPFTSENDVLFVCFNTFTGTSGTSNGFDWARLPAGSTTVTIDHTAASDGDTILFTITYIKD